MNKKENRKLLITLAIEIVVDSPKMAVDNDTRSNYWKNED